MMSRQNTESSELYKRAKFLHLLVSRKVDHHDLLAIAPDQVREVEGGLGEEGPIRMRQAVGRVQGTIAFTLLNYHIINVS